MRELTVTLPDDIAELVRRKVDSGEFPSESEVVREALEAMNDDPMQGPEIEEWLRTVAVQAYDAVKAEPSRALTVEQVRASLAARFERAMKARGS
jgi:antitoxin ParD1/3/4